MKKRKRGKCIIDLNELWDLVWRLTLGLIVTIIFILIFDYPERAMIKDYREKLTNNHCVTRGYINAKNSRMENISQNVNS